MAPAHGATPQTRGWEQDGPAPSPDTAVAVPVRQHSPVPFPRWAQGVAVPSVEPVPLPRAGQSRTQHSMSTADRGEEGEEGERGESTRIRHRHGAPCAARPTPLSHGTQQ